MWMKKLMRKKALHHCAFVTQLVEDKCQVFFPNGYSQYPIRCLDHQRLSIKKVQTVDIVVVYFPSSYPGDISLLYQSLKHSIKPDSVIMVVDKSDDQTGQFMCQWGDDLKHCLGMTGVVDQNQYMGIRPDLKSQMIITGQFWDGQSSRAVSLADIVVY